MVISTTIYNFSKNLRNSNAQSEPNSASATFKEKVCEGAFTGTDCDGDKSFKRSKLLNMQKTKKKQNRDIEPETFDGTWLDTQKKDSIVLSAYTVFNCVFILPLTKNAHFRFKSLTFPHWRCTKWRSNIWEKILAIAAANWQNFNFPGVQRV